MAIDLVLVFMTVTRVAEVDWHAKTYQAWFQCMCEGASIVLYQEANYVHCRQANRIDVEKSI